MNPQEVDLRHAVAEFSDGEGADVVVDAIGLEGSIQLAVDLARPGGKVVVFGNIEARFTAGFADVFMPEKDILGSRANTKEDLEDVTALVAQGKLTPLVSRRFALSEFPQAIAEIDRNSLVGRAVIIP